MLFKLAANSLGLVAEIKRIATGSASAFSEYLAGREQVEDVYRQVTSEVR